MTREEFITYLHAEVTDEMFEAMVLSYIRDYWDIERCDVLTDDLKIYLLHDSLGCEDLSVVINAHNIALDAKDFPEDRFMIASKTDANLYNLAVHLQSLSKWQASCCLRSLHAFLRSCKEFDEEPEVWCLQEPDFTSKYSDYLDQKESDREQADKIFYKACADTVMKELQTLDHSWKMKNWNETRSLLEITGKTELSIWFGQSYATIICNNKRESVFRDNYNENDVISFTKKILTIISALLK